MISSRHEFRRVVFGEGSLARLKIDLDEVGYSKPFVVTTQGRAKHLTAVAALLGDSLVGIFSEAVEHVPVPVTDRAEKALRNSGADVIVAVGGGSPIGLGKALVLRTGLPLVAIPTTYSGSEMTTIYGETTGVGKRTGRDDRVIPRLVVYDPTLTLDLSPETSATSGMNALAHSIEALYASNANSFSDKWAEESVELLSSNLLNVVQHPSNIVSRSAVLRGAYLAGQALNSTSMGLHHRICHVLGGTFQLPHARTHSVMLRYVVAYNFNAAPQPMRTIEKAMNAQNAVSGIEEFSASLPIPRSLEKIGFRESDIEPAAVEIVAGNYPNPRPVTVTSVTNLLRRALTGESPFPLSE